MGGGRGDGGDGHVHVDRWGGGEPLVEAGRVDGYRYGSGFRLPCLLCLPLGRFHDELHDRRRRDHRPPVGHVRPAGALREEAVVEEVRHGVRGYVDLGAPGGSGVLGRRRRGRCRGDRSAAVGGEARGVGRYGGRRGGGWRGYSDGRGEGLRRSPRRCRKGPPGNPGERGADRAGQAGAPGGPARARDEAVGVGRGRTRTATARADQLSCGVRRLPQQRTEFGGSREPARERVQRRCRPGGADRRPGGSR